MAAKRDLNKNKANKQGQREAHEALALIKTAGN